MRRTVTPSLISDQRGAALVEFALVAPVAVLMLLGMMDLLYREYLQSILTGAIQAAGRKSSLESGPNSLAAIDTAVFNAVHEVAANATWHSDRQSFADFNSIAPEPFTDSNSNGQRDPGECFSDINGNGSWDAVPGRTGIGGANDTVLYTMTITYPRLFPVGAWLGWSNEAQVVAKTILKNQPYTSQNVSTPVAICT